MLNSATILTIMEPRNRIKLVLKEKGVKAKWLAQKLEKSYPTIIAYTSNTRQPSLEDLYRIAELLGVSPIDLLEKIERNNKN